MRGLRSLSVLLLCACASNPKAPSSHGPDAVDDADASVPLQSDAAPAGGTGGGEGGSSGSSGASGTSGAGGVGGSGGELAADAAAPDDAADVADTSAPVSADGGPASGPGIPGCTLKWSPSAMRDGTKAFEAAEMPDIQFPGGSPGTHPGVVHITAVADHDAYRIDSHYNPPNAVDYDRVTQTGPMRTDRIRCETRGMVGPAGEVDLLNGQTWRLQWSLYIPSTLKGTGRFTHIMQMKYVDKGGGASGSPIFTVTLRPGDKMEVLFWIGGGSIATVDISQLHDKWLSADLTMKIAPAGNVHWVLKDGATVVVDKTQNGTTWPSDGARLRPKFGIYRGITTGVQTSYIMLADMRAYQCE